MSYLLYALTLFLSSMLLFLVQPMVAKMLLPVLGGSPAVWNTCMVFFQAMLLGGYVYAHVSTKWLGSRRQSIVHMVLMATAIIVLPIAIGVPDQRSIIESPATWVLGALVLSVGLPFFVVSTSAPLLQKWFSNTSHPAANDPYHLYAASNVGSVLALLSYPFLVEPRLGLGTQSVVWMVAYVALCLCVGACAYILWRSPRDDAGKAAMEGMDGDADRWPAAQIEPVREAELAPMTWARRGRWVLWAFIPSSMMLGMTTFITTDIAPIPLLWIAPLTLYLVTFILVFARIQLLKTMWMLRAFPLFLVPLGVLFVFEITDPLWGVTAFHFACLFVFAMVFHGLVADDRPSTDFLTEFYIWISVGGVLGGTFNALIAPTIFDSLMEYPLIVLIAALSIPQRTFQDRAMQYVLAVVMAASLTWVAYLVITGFDLETSTQVLAVITAVLTTAFMLLIIFVWPRLVGVLLGATVVMGLLISNSGDADELHRERSFFAMHRVVKTSWGNYHVLYHGNTTHGVQSREDEFRRVALSYYHLSGPLGQVFEELSKREVNRDVAAVGLGTGAIAAYWRQGRMMTFYEIDAAVERMAKDPKLFTYLTDCGEHCEVIMGDGRLQLAQAPDEHYELIVLDAYSSSSIPIHLLTREALEIYLSKLAPDGIIAFHISNRHLDLEPSLTRLAFEVGLVSRTQDYWVRDRELYDLYIDDSDWVIMARDEAAFGSMVDDERWVDFAPNMDLKPWTDDYSNVLEAYRF